MSGRSGGYRVTGRDMLAYGYEVGEPWAEDRRALEQAFRETDAQNHRSYRTYGGRTTSSNLDGGSTMNTMNPIISSRQSSGTYLYSNAGNVDSGYYGEAPGARLDQSSVAHRVASDNAFRSGTIYPRHEEGRYLYPSRRSEYDEDVHVSPIRRGDHAGSWDSEDDLYESHDGPHARQDRDSDWEDGHQGYGSGGSTGMFDHDQGRWLGSSEYDDHHEYDVDSEDDYYESGSEVFEDESHSGSDDFVGSSGGEESYASESDVGSDGSCEVYYYDSD